MQQERNKSGRVHLNSTEKTCHILGYFLLNTEDMIEMCYKIQTSEGLSGGCRRCGLEGYGGVVREDTIHH